MKKITKLISAFLLLSSIFAGCRNSLISPLGTDKNDDEYVPGYTTVSFEFKEPGRTAFPTFEWGRYTYSLWIKAEWAPEFERLDKTTPFDTYKKETRLPNGNYTFTLKGWDGAEQVLEGSYTVTLNGTESNPKCALYFEMYPYSDPNGTHTGAVIVTVNIPADDPIATAKYCVSASRIVPSDSSDLAPLTITNTAEGRSCIVSKTDLPAAAKQYAVIWFYDDQGSPVCDLRESLQIMTGQTSTSTITITDTWYYSRRDASVTLNKDGNPWGTDDIKIILKDDSTTPAKEYILEPVIDADGKPTGEFTGDVPAGDYEIIIQNTVTGKDPDGNPTVENVLIETDRMYDTETDKVYEKGDEAKNDSDLNVVTVKVPEKGVVLEQVIEDDGGDKTSTVVGKDENGNLIVPEGKDFDVTVDYEDGYEGEPGETVKIGGKDVIPGDETPGADGKPNNLVEGLNPDNIPQAGISVSGVKAKVYKITLGISDATKETISGETEIKYTVEDDIDLLALPDTTVTNISEDKEKLKLGGWKIPDSDDENPYKNLNKTTVGANPPAALVPVWVDNGKSMYTIEYYEQNVACTEHVLVEKKYVWAIRNGTTDVVAPEKAGFDVQNIDQKTISGNDETVVKVKYDRKDITVTLDGNGGAWSDSLTSKTVTGKYGANIINTNGVPAQTHYILKGWKQEGSSSLVTDLSKVTFPADDVTYNAEWEQNEFNYTIKYLFEKAVYDKESEKYESNSNYPDISDNYATLGAKVTATVPPALQGFENGVSEELTITKDESQTVIVRYARKMVTVAFKLDTPETTLGSWDVTEGSATEVKYTTGRYGTKLTNVPTVLLDENSYYVRKGWKKDGVDTVIENLNNINFPPDTTTYTYYFELKYVDYSIEYYKITDNPANPAKWTENLPTSYKTKGKGTIGEKTGRQTGEFGAPKGFDTTRVEDTTLVETPTEASPNVIKVYFTAKDITYTYDKNGGEWSSGNETGVRTGKYSTKVTKPADPTKTGCEFVGWDYSGDTFLLNEDAPENVTTERTIKAIWKSTASVSLSFTWDKNDIAITNTGNVLTVIPPYESASWTYEWYNQFNEVKLSETSSLNCNDTSKFTKGKYTIFLKGKDTSQGTVFSAKIDLTVN